MCWSAAKSIQTKKASIFSFPSNYVSSRGSFLKTLQKSVLLLKKKQVKKTYFNVVFFIAHLHAFSCHIFAATCLSNRVFFFFVFFALHFPNVIRQSDLLAERHLVSQIFCWKRFELLQVLLFLRSFFGGSRYGSRRLHFSLWRRIQFISENHWWLIHWLTLITAPKSFFICRDSSSYWQVSGDSRLWWEVMMWKSGAGGRGEGARGPWQLSHSNKRLPLWTDTRGRGVGLGGGTSLTTQLPQTCHSGCYRAPSSGLDNGLMVCVGISHTSPQ